MIVSNAAEDERPAPISTSLVIYALKPPTACPCSFNPAATPLIRAVVVSFSLSTRERSDASIVMRSYPSEITWYRQFRYCRFPQKAPEYVRMQFHF